jgi:maleate isomerase
VTQFAGPSATPSITGQRAKDISRRHPYRAQLEANTWIGVIVPSSNTTVEADFMRALPAGITVHAARMFLAETTAEAERGMIYDHVPIAVTDLATLRPHVVAFACTSGGAVLGTDGEAALIASIARETAAPVVSTNDAVGRAIETLGKRRVALLTPYIDEGYRSLRTTARRSTGSY